MTDWRKVLLGVAVLAAAVCSLASAVSAQGPASAQVAGTSGPGDLVVAERDKPAAATVAVSPEAGEWERRAAADLVKYVGLITGTPPKLADTADAVAAALKADGPVIVVGRAALQAEPSLAQALSKVVKADPVLRADAIVLRRAGNRVYVAGTNDDSHYYAAAALLGRWGCRWYLPTEFGECVPQHDRLAVGALDFAYAPPFEVRKYWLSWNGDNSGKPEFSKRNFFNEALVPNGHILGKYTKELIPKGKSMFNVPISEDATAEHVAKQVLPIYAAGKDVQLGLEDGVYQSDSPRDKELIALQYDKYFLTQSYTDAFMTFYNGVAERLMKAAPDSKAKIGFLIYTNITLPPVRVTKAAKPLVGYLAPIDFDPIHGMDDPRSGPRREYGDVMRKWAKVLDGRMVIYDYDQSMLVWRDLPNPSHQAFRRDVKHYRDAKILGVDTESRGATATTFLNLYFRGQLQWNPDADVDAMLAEFYEKFYGPAAGPMREYWTAIFRAWEETLVTEHEYFVAPAIYTPELVGKLRKHLAAGEAAAAEWNRNSARAQHTTESLRQLDLFNQRMKFTRTAFDVFDAYMAMTRAANTDVDYKIAVEAGERGLAAREKLTGMNGTFTTYKKIGEHGYAWWPGEVKQYQELLPFTDGSKGTIVAKLPLVWNFRRDPKDVGVKEGWAKQTPDLSWWNALKQPVTVQDRQNNPGHWEQVRSDLYLQAQNLITPDFQSCTGHGWYQTDVELDAKQADGKVHVKFPGLFNECWLYVNGEEVAHRPFKGVWWLNDYRFEWDVDLAGKLKAGKNSVVLRIDNPHHMGGMFRRPFLYRLP
ncbi:MAG TPA: DUF4838 domain-containing protein [Humisphaera sp.]